ncbi:putative DHHC palmitoyltransferase [Trypanosoma vivax]|uniref:Palmitoyltransferase n=1 Tax=Trypanosoma vivax (strain Y486) TaxID=1055687 RepID=G0U3H3_TRYVY|nr:putative DHHC palmitoyltransferase [Trypanosoma vivax]CCC50830.1 conserved hypothetical protein [Trypanosoma vivax Y486]
MPNKEGGASPGNDDTAPSPARSCEVAVDSPRRQEASTSREVAFDSTPNACLTEPHSSHKPERRDQVFAHQWPSAPKRVLGQSRLLWCCVVPRKGANAIGVGLGIVVLDTFFAFGVVQPAILWPHLVIVALSVPALFFLTCAVTVDPGILLPAPFNPTLRPETVVVNGRQMTCKVCSTCNITRPPRSSHCIVCDYCVEEFDHHCTVLGSCVAKRTFRFFVGFLFSFTFLMLFTGIYSVIVLCTAQNDVSTLRGRLTIASAAACTLISALACFFALPMSMLYVYLMCLNSTQKEFANGVHGRCEPNRDYHRGYCQNFFTRCFGPLGKSRISAENAELMIQ